MNQQNPHQNRLPWWAWLILDLAGLFVVAYTLHLDKITGREAIGAAVSITTCGFFAHLMQRKNKGGGGGFTPPPSGVAAIVLLLPLALLALDRRS